MAFWLSQDVPEADRPAAWLKCTMVAVTCAPIGWIVHCMEGWVPLRPLAKPATQLGIIAVSAALVARVVRISGPELLMLLEVAAGTAVISLAIAYRSGG